MHRSIEEIGSALLSWELNKAYNRITSRNNKYFPKNNDESKENIAALAIRFFWKNMSDEQFNLYIWILENTDQSFKFDRYNVLFRVCRNYFDNNLQVHQKINIFSFLSNNLRFINTDPSGLEEVIGTLDHLIQSNLNQNSNEIFMEAIRFLDRLLDKSNFSIKYLDSLTYQKIKKHSQSWVLFLKSNFLGL